MISIKYTQVTVTDGLVEIHPINSEYNAVRVTRKTRLGSYTGGSDKGVSLRLPDDLREPQTYTHEEVLSAEETEWFLDGEYVEEERHIVAVSEDSLELFLTESFPDAYEEAETLSVFEVAKNGGGVFVEFDFGSHMMFDISGNALPVRIHFDYIEAQMNNRAYNLEGVLDTLSKRNDITILSDGIEDIPYYNAERGNDRYIAFTWAPSKKDYQKLWEWCLDNEDDYPSCYFISAVEDLDMLDLNQHRKKEQTWS